MNKSNLFHHKYNFVFVASGITRSVDGDTELARAVDVVMARAKIIYILIIKVNKLLSFFSSWCFLKEIENMYRVSIELYKHS